MDTVLPILLGFAMLATLIALFTGVIAFAFNTKANEKYAGKIMSLRVICQGVALAVFALMVALKVL